MKAFSMIKISAVEALLFLGLAYVLQTYVFSMFGAGGLFASIVDIGNIVGVYLTFLVIFIAYNYVESTKMFQKEVLKRVA